MQRFEPVGWAEEILEAARAADLAQLPRLYTAASLAACTPGGREQAVGYAQAAVALEADARYDPFDPAGPATGRPSPISWPVGWTATWRSAPAWRASRGPGTSWDGAGCSWRCRMAGRDEEARAIAEDTLAAARAHANPYCIAFALLRRLGGPSPRPIRPGPCVSSARGWPTPRSTDSRC